MSNESFATGSDRSTLYDVARMIVDAMDTTFKAGDTETAQEMHAVGVRVLEAFYPKQQVGNVMWGTIVMRERYERGMDRI